MSKLIGKGDLEIVSFASKKAMYDWFLANIESHRGIWLRIYKKASGISSVNWAQAVEVCLCFGWIDSVANKYDEVSYLQKLTPRRSRSVWSKINRETSERLIAEELMRPAGLACVEAAKSDGRWDMAYDSPKTMMIPDEFMRELRTYPNAFATFETLKKGSLYHIGYSLTTAKKQETKDRRMKLIIDTLERGEIPG